MSNIIKSIPELMKEMKTMVDEIVAESEIFIHNHKKEAV